MTKTKVSVRLIVVVALSAAPVFAVGLALLRKMQVALGGVGKLAGAHDYEETVKAQIWNNVGTPTDEV